MCNGVLARLKDDHEYFARFFRAIEHECEILETGERSNYPRLSAIVAYLGATALPRHHALEDVMFCSIVKAMPNFREDVYDLSEDHETSKREFRIFAQSVARADDSFPEAARSFVANERGHFISEEEILFPFAATVLSAEQWQQLLKSLDILADEEHPTVAPEFIRDILSP